MNLYNTILTLCQKRGISPSKMCAEIGITKSLPSDLKHGRITSISQKNMKLIADYFSVSTDFLLGRDDMPPDVRQVRHRNVPMLGQLSCGEAVSTARECDAYFDENSDLDIDMCLTFKGDSMEGAGIFDGDVVFLKSTSTVPNGEIAAVQIGNETSLKKWEYYPEKNMLILAPCNARYNTLVYQGEELNGIRCLGYAVSVLRRLSFSSDSSTREDALPRSTQGKRGTKTLSDRSAMAVDSTFTEKELSVASAYREHPEMHDAIDRLLCISPE